ncbi:MAG: NAD(P)-dependent oxidoreductase [Thermoleophilia bacterium]|nr:NAD(P)-dependent oxidoreductase [Thermoleophilia bacterium]
MKLAYIGLGNLGEHIAMNLVKAGHEVAVFDLNEETGKALIGAGARWASSAADAATGAEAVLTCLPSTRAIEIVVTEILTVMPAGSAWLDNSTNDRDVIMRLAETAAAQGVRAVEAPVTGGVHLAKAGEITVILGGDDAVVQEFMPIFQIIGNRIFHVGAVGQASKIKAITNMLAFIHLVADGEALMLAKKGGIDLKTAYDVIQASSGNSFVHETEGQLVLNGSYQIDFSIDLVLKDLGFIDDMSREYNVPVELASLVRQTYIRGKAQYGGDAESPMIVKLLEDACGTDLRAPGFPARIEA